MLSIAKSRTFVGKRDVESGLDYRGARFYDSDIGRFLSLDPLAVDYANWSAYNYVLGNPVMLVDPDGRAPKSIDHDWKENSKGVLIRVRDTNSKTHTITRRDGSVESFSGNIGDYGMPVENAFQGIARVSGLEGAVNFAISSMTFGIRTLIGMGPDSESHNAEDYFDTGKTRTNEGVEIQAPESSANGTLAVDEGSAKSIIELGKDNVIVGGKATNLGPVFRNAKSINGAVQPNINYKNDTTDHSFVKDMIIIEFPDGSSKQAWKNE